MRPMRPLSTLLAGLSLPLVLAVAACSPADAPASETSSASTSGSATAQACSKDSLPVRTAGKFTVATDKPAYAPWFVDDNPSNGKGFESAVAYAVAEKLGFAQSDVVWTTASFNSVIAPGTKTFDVDVNQVSITDERKKNVDFSSGYYDVTQAVVTIKGSKAANVTTLAGLKDLKLGGQIGTTSLQAITDVIKPTAAVGRFNSNDDAKLALTNGTIDAIVVDLPTALYLASAGSKDGGLDNGKIVGQLENGSGQAEQFGMVLDKGSKLTTCVSQAVDALRTDGTLDKLESQWLTSTAGAPVLK